MNKNSTYFHVIETENELIIDDRLEVNWKEIIFYPLSFFYMGFYFREQWFVILPLVLLVSISYLFFRFFAWVFYKEIRINKISKRIEKTHFFIKRERSTILIDAVFSSSNISFVNLERSGGVKYLLRYSTYKKHDLLVVKSEEDKMFIKAILLQIG